MKPARISTTGWLGLLLVMAMFIETRAGLAAEEKAATKTPPPVIWKLDNVTSVGGQKPDVLGAPKVVDAEAGGPAVRFNGQNDALVVPVNPLAGWKTFTVEVLCLPETNGLEEQRFFYILDDRNERLAMETHSADGRAWCLDTYLMTCRAGVTNDLTLCDTNLLHSNGQWTWTALVYDGKTMSHYVNGVQELQGKVAIQPMTNGNTFIGARFDRTYWFKGCIKELRFTPAALKTEALQCMPKK